MIEIQLKLNTDKEDIDWDNLFVNFVDDIVFYNDEVYDLKTFKEKFEVDDV